MRAIPWLLAGLLTSGGAMAAGQPQPAVGQLQAAPAAGRAALGVTGINQATRPPTASDDVTTPLSTGALWAANGDILQLQDNTAGAALWQSVQTNALPLDVIGLYVSAAAVSAGGTGYAVNDTVSLVGGAVLRVTTVSSGAITAGSVTTPNMFACAPANPASQISTSGAGIGAAFTLTLLKPTAYGMRRLGQCYTGNALTAVRSDNLASIAIPFLASNELDTRTLDAFVQGSAPIASYQFYTSGVIPYVSLWNDQGGGGNDATQATVASRPTIYPGRKIGNSRSIMFNAHGAGTSWTPNLTSMTLPAGVSINGNNFSVAVLGGTKTVGFQKSAFINIGCTTGGCFTAGFQVGPFSNPAQLEFDNGGTSSNVGIMPTDTPLLMVGVSNASTTTVDAGNKSVAVSGTGTTFAISGGALGVPGGNSGTGGFVDEAAVIIVPWALPATTRVALEASFHQSFGTTPQVGGVIAVIGDSHVDGWGVPFGQSWPRQMMPLLGRPDIQLMNAGASGGQLSNFVGATFWNTYVAPNLAATNSVNKFVLIQGGYNDLIAAQTTAQVVASYQAGITKARAAGAKAVCVLDVLRIATTTINAAMQSITTSLRAPGVCDALIDFQALAVFNSTTTWAAPWFDSDQTHLTAQGNALSAAVAAAALVKILQ